MVHLLLIIVPCPWTCILSSSFCTNNCSILHPRHGTVVFNLVEEYMKSIFQFGIVVILAIIFKARLWSTSVDMEQFYCNQENCPAVMRKNTKH